MFLTFIWFDIVGNLESMKPVNVVAQYLNFTIPMEFSYVYY